MHAAMRRGSRSMRRAERSVALLVLVLLSLSTRADFAEDVSDDLYGDSGSGALPSAPPSWLPSAPPPSLPPPGTPPQLTGLPPPPPTTRQRCADVADEHGCPTQCMWCLEKQLCTNSWESCSLSPPDAPVVFSAVVMLLTLGGALLCAFAALRQSGHVAGLPDVDSGGGEDYRSAHAEDPFNPVAVPVGHDAMEASHTYSAARQPEGQRLLSEL